jgi:hypothetical protein
MREQHTGIRPNVNRIAHVVLFALSSPSLHPSHRCSYHRRHHRCIPSPSSHPPLLSSSLIAPLHLEFFIAASLSLPDLQCDPKFVRNLRFAKANNVRRVKKEAAAPAAAKKA